VLVQISRNEGLKAKGLRLAGLAYKDDPVNSRKFLAEVGNPYALIGVDRSGRAGIDWGVYGVPETFLVRGDGVIAYKFVGPLDPQSAREKLIPEIEKLLR
jgi:cytochrome c biogenesis protein CcmG/thiol:disulfide interchange protein DsbE